MNAPSRAQSELAPGDWDALFRILGGHIYFQTLSAAVRLNLFGLLKQHGALTRPQICEYLGLQEKPGRILLLGCATLELVQKTGPLYSNSNLAERLLIREAPGNIVSVVEWQHHINYQAMFYFYDALKANRNVGLSVFDGDEQTLYARLTHHPELEQIFQDAMKSISVQANAMLAEHVDFSGVRHLVDVGGGNGSNIITLAKKYSHLHASVFDSETVCRIARQNIEACGLADRLGATAGDCFDDEFPSGVDCLLFAHFLTIWSAEQNRTLLGKCYKALPSGGSVIVFNMMQSDDETGPLSAAMGSPYFLTLATGTGMLYTWQEYEAWIKEAGFTRVTRQTLPLDHGAIIGYKP